MKLFQLLLHRLVNWITVMNTPVVAQALCSSLGGESYSRPITSVKSAGGSSNILLLKNLFRKRVVFIFMYQYHEELL